MNTRKTILTAEEKELAGLIAKQCSNQGDIHEVLKRLFAGTVEEILEAEMEEHLGYEKNSYAGRNSGNSRNGYLSKTVVTILVHVFDCAVCTDRVIQKMLLYCLV